MLAVGAAALAYVWWRERSARTRAAVSRVLVTGAVVVALVGVVGTTVQVARIGHSGATASWSDVAKK